MILPILVAYFVGSVPFAFLLARWWGRADLRYVGSGNLGAANVVRASGVGAGLLVAALDVAKGATAVVVASRLGASLEWCAAAGLACIVGHVYPLWLRFRGGKGVATSCGVFLVLTPAAALAALAVFGIAVWITRYVSLGSVISSAVLPPMAYEAGAAPVVVGTACAAALLIIFRHRSNLARLRMGTERRLLAS